MMRALHWAMTRSGFEMMNYGEPTALDWCDEALALLEPLTAR